MAEGLEDASSSRIEYLPDDFELLFWESHAMRFSNLEDMALRERISGAESVCVEETKFVIILGSL